MALNAILVHFRERGDPRAAQAETVWGRSYQEHLKAVANEPGTDELDLPAARAPARILLTAPVGGQPLVTLGHDPTALARSALTAAETIVEICAATVAGVDRPS